MKTHPMLFSGPMIRALLDGRKTQTRRILKPSTNEHGRQVWPCFQNGKRNDVMCWPPRIAVGPNESRLSPVAIDPGDLIWARESWSGEYVFGNIPPSQRKPLDTGHGTFAFPANIHYWADGEPISGDWERGRPSIHMPKWASRITLEVTDVRVQLLQDISADDARAEGALTGDHSVYAFSLLWNSINGPDAWEQNPWVVAYSFTVHQCNVDQMGEAA